MLYWSTARPWVQRGKSAVKLCFARSPSFVAQFRRIALSIGNISIPRCFMYGIFTYAWAIMVNVGKCSIHGASGIAMLVYQRVVIVRCKTMGKEIGKMWESGWCLTYSSEKYKFISWDDEIPFIWKNKVFQTTNQYLGETATCRMFGHFTVSCSTKNNVAHPIDVCCFTTSMHIIVVGIKSHSHGSRWIETDI